MKNTRHQSLSAAQQEALEARVGLRISAHLEKGAQQLPHDITERLRVARQQAIAQAKQRHVEAVQIQTAPAVVQSGWRLAGGLASGLGGWSSALARTKGHGRQLDDAPMGWGWRLASMLPVVALLGGLWGIHTWYKHEQAVAAADVDIALLADELPPNAYSDPGFEEFLNSADANDAQPEVSEEPIDLTESEHETT